MDRIRAALADLNHADPRARDLAAAHLGDVLESPSLSPADAETIVGRLVALCTVETDPTVLECALHSIDGNTRELPLRLLEPLRPMLNSMTPELLDYALDIFACTHDPRARPIIEGFLDHPSATVRESAAEALTELPGRRP